MVFQADSAQNASDGRDTLGSLQLSPETPIWV